MCSYCFEKGSPLSQMGGDHINKSDIFNFVKNILNLYSPNEVDIIFSGGEPLMKFDLIKGIIDFFNKEYPVLKIRPILLTNGVLLDYNKIDYLNRNEVRIKLSIDGDEKINDVNRKFKNSEESVYHNLLNKMSLIKKLGVAMVVLPKTLPSLYFSINNLYLLGVKRFYLNFEVVLSKWTQDDYSVLKEQLRKISDLYLMEKPPLFINYLEKNPGTNKNPCHTSFSQNIRFVLMPNGDVLPCLAGIMPISSEIYGSLKYGRIGDLKNEALHDIIHRKKEISKFAEQFESYICYKKDAYGNLIKINNLLREEYEYVKSGKNI
ncbi:MAG: 4Fe-4S cluster-binding domain-containing protein [Mariniphaga sp.]|nr:4Fe-4S cluster-binding domain-containing protein [Mariniphaga sp.]